MNLRNPFLYLALCLFSLKGSNGYVEAVSANIDVFRTTPSMQVAMACDKNGVRYHNQYKDASGAWVTDLEHKQACMKIKGDILNYCRLVYPSIDFTNVVQLSHSHRIHDWCRVGHSKCEESFWLKPYKCLQSNHDEDATEPLSVPPECRFDQIQRGSLCQNPHQWIKAANESCNGHGMELDSFSNIHPCDNSSYNGVEFVCCPLKNKKLFKKRVGTNLSVSSFDETTSKPNMEDELVTRDPYFTKFDPRIEHDAFKAAERRLEEAHKRKITKIMKEWTELEERYQKIKTKDPNRADKFKLRMTERFNKMMNAIKDQGAAEKHQLIDLHQQRIIAHINERKKDGMKCFVKALNERPPSSALVEKCLNHLIRALFKDRHHTISHYKHLMITNPESAEAQQVATVEHLRDVDRMVNESMQMLDRYPNLHEAMLPDMQLTVDELRQRDDLPAELVSTTAVGPEDIQGDNSAWRNNNEDDEDQEINDNVNRIDIDVEVERRPVALAVQRIVDPLPAHVQVRQHAHGEATFQVVAEKEAPSSGNGWGMYVMVTLASLALAMALMAGVTVVCRHQRAPHKGFIEVDQAITPEERHLTQMQINGYENPTYRYFESK